MNTLPDDMIFYIVGLADEDPSFIVSLMSTCKPWRKAVGRALLWADLAEDLLCSTTGNQIGYQLFGYSRVEMGTYEQYLYAIRIVKAAKLAARTDSLAFDVVSELDAKNTRYLYKGSLYRTIRGVSMQAGFLYLELSWYKFALRVMKESICCLLDTAYTLLSYTQTAS